MEEKQLHELIEKYLDGSASDEEREFLLQWYRTVNDNDIQWIIGSDEQKDELKNEILNKIVAAIYKDNNTGIAWAKLSAIAASLLLLITLSITLIISRHHHTAQVAEKNIKDILPGGQRATLTLSNGSNIVLDNLKTGTISSSGITKIVKAANGKLIYEPTEAPHPNTGTLYNTLKIPRGGTFNIVLSDGTKVWLNSSSSIKYPVSFSGHERLVYLTGEGYFEVVHNNKQPFRVKAGNELIEDIGTHFNIKAYEEDKKNKITLTEGKARVSKGKQAVVLSKGEQAVITSDIHVNSNANIEEATAWKSGIFEFDNANLEDVMQQISRWYNVSVEYKTKPGNDLFNGKIPMNLPLSKSLLILQQAGVRFEIRVNNNSSTGKIIISP